MGRPSGSGACSATSIGRSEEHTSELQSQPNLVCRLLLEKTNPAGCASLCPERPKETPLNALLADGRVRARVAQGLRSLAAEAHGSSTHATRALLLAEPPSIDANEITDKGYINQRAVLGRRAAAVSDLYRAPAPP